MSPNEGTDIADNYGLFSNLYAVAYLSGLNDGTGADMDEVCYARGIKGKASALRQAGCIIGRPQLNSPFDHLARRAYDRPFADEAVPAHGDGDVLPCCIALQVSAQSRARLDDGLSTEDDVRRAEYRGFPGYLVWTCQMVTMVEAQWDAVG